MQFRTIVDIPAPKWKINPCERMLFVGSCFADNMGRRFRDEKFRGIANPYGVMYNPASILHTVERLVMEKALPFATEEAGTAVFTLGTNHVYILKETGKIVDNCQKKPQNLFEERELTIAECADYIRRSIGVIHSHFPQVNIMLTISPIRYRKYGYHGSQLSKATLLLAIDDVIKNYDTNRRGNIAYFPSYEIVNDELRDYRFYEEDMLHPSAQAVDYIFERLGETYFSDETIEFLKAWKPIREAFTHKPFNPESSEYKAFRAKTEEKAKELQRRYPALEL
jgi:hypothetical protein